MHAKIRRR